MDEAKFTLRLDRTLLVGITERAKQEHRSVNQMICVLIIRYLAEAEATS